MTKQDKGLAGHSALSQVQLSGTVTTQAAGDAMAEDHLSFLPQHHHPFLPLVTWSRYTRVPKEDGAPGNRNKNVQDLLFLNLTPCKGDTSHLAQDPRRGHLVVPRGERL